MNIEQKEKRYRVASYTTRNDGSTVWCIADHFNEISGTGDSGFCPLMNHPNCSLALFDDQWFAELIADDLERSRTIKRSWSGWSRSAI